MQEFEVGSFVWFIRNDKPAIYHYLVVEEIVKNSIGGTTRDYVFEMTAGNGRKGKTSSKNLDGNYFLKREDAYDFMLEQAGIAIQGMMGKAEYKDSENTQEPKVVEQPQQNIEETEEAIIELPDGTKARLKGGIPK